MAEDNNGDVDRAMAAFAATPMRYFTATPVAPSDTTRVSVGEPPVRCQVSAAQVAAFPLLIAALPGINQTSLPVQPVAEEPVLGKHEMSTSAARKAELLARRAKALDRPVPQRPEMMSISETGNVPNLSAVFGLPPRYAPAPKMSGQRAPAPHVANGPITPMATIFKKLHAASPSHDAPAETGPGLRDIFSRL